MRSEPIARRAELTDLRRFTWWSVTSMTTTVMVVIVAVGLVTAPKAPDPWTVVGVGALMVAAFASATLLARRLRWPTAPGSVRGPVDVRGWNLAGNASAVVLAGLLLAEHHELWAVGPATTVALSATFLPTRRAWAAVGATAVLAGAIGAVAAPGLGSGPLTAVLLPIGLVVTLAATTLGMLWSWDVTERLDGARRLTAEVAVKDERLRFAAELHDIQGHNLQVIALKSELAARLVATDPDRASRELEDVRRLAAEALQDARAVVQGYRRTTLRDEIANATKVLEAAGIGATMHLEPGGATVPTSLPDATQHLLGLVVREATTNVLRHSRARTAEVTYVATARTAHLRVANDGVTAVPRPDAGSGLAMLAERLETAGGTLAFASTAGRFVLDATLPLGTGTAQEPA
jgi:two-component system, NarL family, sensor histidine kinase DesK